MARIHVFDETGEYSFCGYILTDENWNRFTTDIGKSTCLSCANFISGKWNRNWNYNLGRKDDA